VDIFSTLIQWDKQAFLSLNGLHNAWMDRFMWLMSETALWIPFFLYFVYLLVRYKKTESLWLLLLIGIMVTFTDQIASGVFKPLVERLRPTHDPALSGLVHVVNDYHGGRYGFFSSHASNVFAFAGLSLLWIRRWYYSVLILLWASIVSYSRIYLGVHFPLDILTGLVFGLASSFGFHYLYQSLISGKGNKRTSKTTKRRKSDALFPQKEVDMLCLLLIIILIVCMLASYYLNW
jgi:undecaprenyl-diphosphatase